MCYIVSKLLSQIFLVLPTFCGENMGNMRIIQYTHSYKKLDLTLPTKQFLNLNFFRPMLFQSNIFNIIIYFKFSKFKKNAAMGFRI